MTMVLVTEIRIVVVAVVKTLLLMSMVMMVTMILLIVVMLIAMVVVKITGAKHIRVQAYSGAQKASAMILKGVRHDPKRGPP